MNSRVSKAIRLRRKLTKVQRKAESEIENLSDELDQLYDTFSDAEQVEYWERLSQ